MPLTLTESKDDSDDNPKDQLTFLEEKLYEILSALVLKSEIRDPESCEQVFKPETQTFVNIFNVEQIPKEIIHRILLELSFYERLALMLVSKQAKKIINEMPFHEKYIFIKNVFMISIEQLNQEYDLAIMPDNLKAIKPRTIYLKEIHGKIAYTVIPFNKSKLVQNIDTSLNVPERFSIETLLTLKEEILTITAKNYHSQNKAKSSWTYKELRKLDVLNNVFKADATLVTTYANEVQEETRAKFPWLIREPVGMTILWFLFSASFMIPIIIVEEKTLKYVNSTHNFTKQEQSLLSYAGDGFYAGCTMLSGLLSLLVVLMLREKYVAIRNHSARNDARQLFGFFKDESSEEGNYQIAEIEELKDEQCIVTFLSEDEEELLLNRRVFI